MYLRAYIAVAEAHAGDGEWEGGNDGGREAVRGCPVYSLVARPAHQLRELGTQAYYGDIGCSQNFDFLLMESHHFIEIVFEYTNKNWIIAKKIF